MPTNSFVEATVVDLDDFTDSIEGHYLNIIDQIPAKNIPLTDFIEVIFTEGSKTIMSDETDIDTENHIREFLESVAPYSTPDTVLEDVTEYALECVKLAKQHLILLMGLFGESPTSYFVYHVRGSLYLFIKEDAHDSFTKRFLGRHQ